MSGLSYFLAWKQKNASRSGGSGFHKLGYHPMWRSSVAGGPKSQYFLRGSVVVTVRAPMPTVSKREECEHSGGRPVVWHTGPAPTYAPLRGLLQCMRWMKCFSGCCRKKGPTPSMSSTSLRSALSPSCWAFRHQADLPSDRRWASRKTATYQAGGQIKEVGLARVAGDLREGVQHAQQLHLPASIVQAERIPVVVWQSDPRQISAARTAGVGSGRTVCVEAERQRLRHVVDVPNKLVAGVLGPFVYHLRRNTRDVVDVRRLVKLFQPRLAVAVHHLLIRGLLLRCVYGLHRHQPLDEDHHRNGHTVWRPWHWTPRPCASSTWKHRAQ
eukprot:scaffold1934_cov444-Prasinococcus_capsulatus_cf.AAC.5